MNDLKIKIYKRVLKEVSEKILQNSELYKHEDICSQEKLSAGMVTCFLCFLVSFLAVK